MSALRPLPPRPSLEFEHKEAKALLRRLRAGDPEARARALARHPAIDASAPAHIRLADAQLVIAREYGFTSWPRLVRFFGDVERQRHGHYSIQSGERDFYDSSVRSLLAEHRQRRAWAGRTLAAYVPRFYGLRMDDVYASTVTEDEARLAVARTHGYANWDLLLERTASEVRQRPGPLEVHPMRRAHEAMAAVDLEALKRVVAAHPELLHRSAHDTAKGRGLMRTAVHHERTLGIEVMRPIIEWLESQGLDLQLELNVRLCGHRRMKTERVRWLLERGADPDWIAPNGIPVLEHALIRYWNGEAADLVAARAVPRKALWIAAGLGDVEGVRRSLDANGKPKREAYRLRPDFDAVGPDHLPSHPDPSDDELLMEAFFIALLNGRSEVLEYMVSRGFDVNSLIWDSPIISMAIGNAMTPIVECLIRCGADLDIRGWRPNQSPREIARSMFESMSDDPERRRIAELCGLDPEAILAEQDARPVNPPGLGKPVLEILELAGDDAYRLDQAEIGVENLLFGLLRSDGLGVQFFGWPSGLDLDRFRTDVADRVRPGGDRVQRPRLPMDADAQAAIRDAVAIATERRGHAVSPLHLLYALTRSGQSVAARLVERYGGSIERLNTALERVL